MSEWGFDYGDNSRMQTVADVVFAPTSADVAAQRLCNLHPRADELRVGILVRQARKERNAHHRGEVNEAIHELALLLNRADRASIDDPAPTPRPGWTARLRTWWGRRGR